MTRGSRILSVRTLLLLAAAASLLLTGVAHAAPLPLPPLGPAAEEPADDATTDEPAPGASSGGSPAADEPAADEPAADEPADEPAATSTDYAAEIVTLTNSEHEREGCEPLDVDDRLTAAAQLHAEDMADHQQMTHVGSNGSKFHQRIRDQGHPEPGAENVARGYPDAATTVREWMASPAHRKNIVSCTYVTIGVGFDPRGNFVAQEFGRPE